MKIVIFFILPILIAILYKYVILSGQVLRQVERGEEPNIDPMQRALMPEIVIFIILSLLIYALVERFFLINSEKYILFGQLGITLLLIPSAVKYRVAKRKNQL